MSKGTRHAEAVRLREMGLTFAEIGEQLGITKDGASSIYYKRTTGKRPGRVSGVKKPMFDEATRYRAMGLSYEEIGKLLDVSRQCIHQLLNTKGDSK